MAAGLMAQQVQYTLTKMETGLSGSNWGAVTTQNGDMIFCNSEKDEGKDTKYTKLYMLRPGGTPQALFKDEKDLKHIGAPYVTPDGSELYCAITSEKVKVTQNRGLFKSGEVYYPQQIARSQRLANGEWGPLAMFRYNMDNYNSGDPWLSNDGQYLYFASDRPGGMGGMDLWRSRRNADGSWASPENVRELNTKGNERSPRFDVNGNFYYATENGSYGGLDIFSCALLKNGHFTTPVRMATPLNSTNDDFAITFADEYRGYISSNRSGEDAIYKFEKISNELTANITVVDVRDGRALPEAQLYFMSEQACDSKFVTTDADGKVSLKLEPEAPYSVLVYREEYVPADLRNEWAKNFTNRTISLEGMPKKCDECPTCPLTGEPMLPSSAVSGQALILSKVNFDFNKWNLRAQAARELDAIVRELKEQGHLKLEVSAYTDCRGSASYNRVLSQKRANAVKAYLVSRGIAPSRISAVGYGMDKPLAYCSCNFCDELEHAENRRAEFRFIE